MIDLDKPIPFVPVDLKPPAATAQPWLCWRRGKPTRCVIKWAQCWMTARGKAAVTLGCEPGEVEAKLPESEE